MLKILFISLLFFYLFATTVKCYIVCTDEDEKIIYTCYKQHFNKYNSTFDDPNYYESFFYLTFSNMPKQECKFFKTLGKCIGDERLDSCVTEASLSEILKVNVKTSKDIIFIYKRMEIFCNALKKTDFGYLGSYPGTAADVYCGLPDPLFYRRSHKESNCDKYSSYMDCSIQEITGPCLPPTARMHCEFMNLIISTYHSYCDELPIFNCSDYNYKKFLEDYEDETFDDVEYEISIFYWRFYNSATFYTRLFYFSVFISIFYSMIFKKNSPLRNSFFILFLIIPFYDTIWLCFDGLEIIPYLKNNFIIDKVNFYLQNNRVDIMPVILLPLCLNRFTAVTFPFKHNKIWNICFTQLILTLTLLLCIIPILINFLITKTVSKSAVDCQNDPSIYCYFYSFDYGEWATDINLNFREYRMIFSLIICSICFLLLGISILNSKIRSIKNSSKISKPEKRLFLITLIEISGATIFVIIYYFDRILPTNIGLLISEYSQLFYYFHHLSSVVLFLFLSKFAIKAYLHFFFIDRIYTLVLRKTMHKSGTWNLWTTSTIPSIESSKTKSSMRKK